MDKLSNIRKCIFEKTKGGMHMAIEVFNRYEKKYMLNAIQYEKLTQAISEYMVVDAYNRVSRSMKSATFIMIHRIIH